jgi:mannan endo-1,4-beta-mannosidase
MANHGASSQTGLRTDPANPDLTEEARAVLAYIHSLPGEGCLLGQQENDDSVDAEQSYIQEVTGEKPALRGFDMAEYIVDPVEEAIDSWQEHGQLVTLSWHLRMPHTESEFENVLDQPEECEVHEDTNEEYGGEADVEAALTEGTDEHQWLLETIDWMADELERLADANVPVLWRPYHEMDGGWFWWSNAGPDGFPALWEQMFERFVEERGLDNLIWVWSGSHCHPGEEWYPGDEYVDVVGVDTYRNQIPDIDFGEQYRNVRSITEEKPVAQAECDEMVDPDVVPEEYPFVWTLPWHTSLIRFNDEEYIRRVYDHPYTITAQELPQF